MTTEIETHPHLHLFDRSFQWQYLVIGTFPPNSRVREERNLFVDYFYGNKGFFWRILHDIYQPLGFNFLAADKEERLRQIRSWQVRFRVGISDTVHSCSRKQIKSPDDSDLRIVKYNLELKDYLLNEGRSIRKIIFTSSSGKNSAYANFKLIMGEDIMDLNDKLVTGLPSPSGSANINFFNSDDELTLGLQKDFFEYVSEYHPQALDELGHRWAQKKHRKGRPAELRDSVVVKPAPRGLVKAYKIWKYSQVFPHSTELD